MKQDVLVWRAKETGVFSREEAKKNTEKNIQLEGIYYKIGDGAFKNNIRIHSVILDENVKEIGQESFYNCTSLRQIKMGQIRIIHKYAFYNCTRLTEIELPKETEFIGARAFSLCKRLQGIQFSGKINVRKFRMKFLQTARVWKK